MSRSLGSFTAAVVHQSVDSLIRQGEVLKFTGTHTVSAVPERTFELLIDPEVLARCMPGCDKLEHRADGVYDMAVSAGIGPIRGKYTGSVTLSDIHPPERYTMSVDIRGATGFVKGRTRARRRKYAGHIRWRRANRRPTRRRGPTHARQRRPLDDAATLWRH